MATLRVVSPVDDSIYVERQLAAWDEIDRILNRAVETQKNWQSVPVVERQEIGLRFAERLAERADELAPELSWQMGRPIRFAPREITTAAERGRRMVDLATPGLADVAVESPPGFDLFIRRVPLGVVLVVPAWNYPYLIAINSLLPAILAGNSVVMKHSSQTPLVAERLGEVLAEAGLPEGVYQFVHAGHAETERAVGDARVAFVAFTGSVTGGHAMVEAARNRFIGCGLELGGKDPAYVRPDVDLDSAVESLVDGSFFNSGQSCCGIERIYVHRDLYRAFVEAFVALTRRYTLGNPLEAETDLGPLARRTHADLVRSHVSEAVQRGARALVPGDGFPAATPDGPYLAPQVLVEVDHSMRVMREETFGPVVGIMEVADDEEAVAMMNDSPYGLTASVWTRDRGAAIAIGERIETGTWFMNRCDYLDPGLAWVGVKDSGRGCTLSRLGYEQLTRPKSFHLRLAV